METGDVGIWENIALKITFLTRSLQSWDLQFFPIYGKNATIFANSTGTSPQKVKKKKITGLCAVNIRILLHFKLFKGIRIMKHIMLVFIYVFL